MEANRLLVTGGSGLLGGELKAILPRADFPFTAAFNVCDFEQMDRYILDRGIDCILHAGAFTSPPKINEDPVRALEVNIIGTAKVVRLCVKHGLRMVYVSTDYVFRGDAGNYGEDDAVCPVNKYAWSKLGGECAVRLYDRALIIRTSFGENEFPYPKAFADQWTSRLCVRDAAPRIAKAALSELTGVLHIGGPRRTVLEYAQSLDPDKEIGPLSVEDVSFNVPVDTSLNTERYERELG
ncbi:MAG: sugar nucleotide-binding protein [Candidatus Hydrogenedens sp.]|nr:sugar nucleotide-binding protein [Candidatus Hydrogenedens sp.]